MWMLSVPVDQLDFGRCRCKMSGVLLPVSVTGLNGGGFGIKGDVGVMGGFSVPSFSLILEHAISISYGRVQSPEGATNAVTRTTRTRAIGYEGWQYFLAAKFFRLVKAPSPQFLPIFWQNKHR